MRIQFYPSSLLEEKIKEDAERLGITPSALVNDLLNKYYAVNQPGGMSNAQLEKVVFSEAAEFVRNQDIGIEFDMRAASATFCEISNRNTRKGDMRNTYLGKRFNNKYVGKIAPFDRVEQARKPNGALKKSSNQAAVYKIVR